MHAGRMRKLMLWDTAGQEKFSSLIPSSIRDNDCAVIVFDAANPSSFLNCKRWVHILEETCTPNSNVVVAANKIDLGRKVSRKLGLEWAVRHGFSYMEVSASSGQGMEELISEIIDSIDNCFK